MVGSSGTGIGAIVGVADGGVTATGVLHRLYCVISPPLEAVQDQIINHPSGLRVTTALHAPCSSMGTVPGQEREKPGIVLPKS